MKKILIFTAILSVLVLCNEAKGQYPDSYWLSQRISFLNEIEFDASETVGLISVSSGGFKVTTHETNPRFYGKVLGGAGIDWIIIGPSLLYYQRNLNDTTASPNPEQLFGMGAFIRFDGGSCADIPISLGYEAGVANGLYHSITIGYGGALKITVSFDFFEEAKQPVLGAGLSYVFD